jgi:hypothetical protein
MKKTIFILGTCLLLLAVLAAGCLGGNDPADNSSNNTSDNSSSSGNSSNVTAPPDPIRPPADTAVYRGNIKSITAEGDATKIVLNQVRGTNYGIYEMTFLLNNNSRVNFGSQNLIPGQYLEVYYNPNDLSSGMRTIIVANLLQNSDLVIYIGQITNVYEAPENSSYYGQMEVKLENNSTMIFNYDGQTQFYMDLSNLKAGTNVSIYGNWIISPSMPPQTTAYEVREYSD